MRGTDRTFGRFVPDDYNAEKSYPLVFVLHGDGGDGAAIRKRFAIEGAARGGAIFVYPDGLNHTWLQAKEQSDNDDFFFFDAMVAQTSDLYRVDTHRIFVTGFSSGAYMANQLGCFRGGSIRAIAPNSGGGPYDATGKAYNAEGHLQCNGKPVPALIIHGDRDSVVPIAEGQKSLAHWQFVNHCGNDSHAWTVSDACISTTCKEPVVFCTIKGEGHQVWSEAPQTVWKFFASFP